MKGFLRVLTTITKTLASLQTATRKGKPGRGTANISLPGVRVWAINATTVIQYVWIFDMPHLNVKWFVCDMFQQVLAQGSVPIVVSSQGSNPNLPSQPTSLNIHLNGATEKASTSLIIIFECFTICLISKWFVYSFQRERPVKKNKIIVSNDNAQSCANAPCTSGNQVVIGFRAIPTGGSQSETSVSISTATVVASQSISSSFSLRF